MLTLLCWATKPSLNLAFYHFPSRITLDISAAIQLLSSRKLPLPVIYISQSPSASFPLSPSSKHKHEIGSEDFDAGIQEISSEAQQGSFRLSRARWWCDWGFLFLFICPNCVWAKPVVIYQQNLTNGAVFRRDRYRVWNTWITRNAKNCQRKQKISLAA